LDIYDSGRASPAARRDQDREAGDWLWARQDGRNGGRDDEYAGRMTATARRDISA
jgi:hypothetical protein